MADTSYGPLVYHKQGGDELVVASGGVLNIETGGIIETNGTQGAALTAALTALTHTAPGTPDYAIQALVQNTGFGFVTADEGETVLNVIQNLVTRVGELEARLQAMGMIA